MKGYPGPGNFSGICANPVDHLLSLAIQEDLGHGDVTSETIFDPDHVSEAVVSGRESFVLSGSHPFTRVFYLLDPSVRIDSFSRTGIRFRPTPRSFASRAGLEPYLPGNARH